MKPKVLAIIQARLGSKRFPRKILADIHGRRMLDWVIKRVSDAKTVDKIAVALPQQDVCEVIKVAPRTIYYGFAGDEDDVLSRFVRASNEHTEYSIIVRICADSPLVDPAKIDEMVMFLESMSKDSSYCKQDGLGSEVFTRKFLVKFGDRKDSLSREHVTAFGQRRGEPLEPYFTSYTHAYPYCKNLNKKYSVDTEEDLNFVRGLASNAEEFAALDTVKLAMKERGWA